MFRLNCPACGAEVVFKSKASVYGACNFCKATLVRHDLNVEKYGLQAELMDDMTPLQIGTRGRFEEQGFELIGRLRIGWQDGYWNEWYALFDDAREGWLAEAQGFYALCFQVDETDFLPPKEKLLTGTVVPLGKFGMHVVEDIRDVVCIGSEGELPFMAPKGRKSTSVDLGGEEGRFACIEYADKQTRLFAGQYIEYDNLKFKMTRDIDGW